MLELQIIDDPAVALAMLDPLRRTVLTALAEPGSASSVATDLGLPRQKVNYHLRTLEEHGLVALLEERPRRGVTERVMRASARSYVISPDVLGSMAPDPQRTDVLSARYLVAAASRTIREVASMLKRADAAGQTLPSLTIDTEITFGSPGDRQAFTQELAAEVARLVSTYHDEKNPRGRPHRLLVAAHPRPATTTNPTQTEPAEESHDR